MGQATAVRKVWTIFDIHNTSVVYVRASYVPWYTGKVISKGQMIDPHNSPGFRLALGKSQLAVQDQYQEWAKMHSKEIGDLTPDDELEAESHFVLSGLEQLTALETGRRDKINLHAANATFVVPIAGAKEVYQHALEDRAVDGTRHLGCVAVISSSKTEQSSAIVRYLLGDRVYGEFVQSGRLIVVNAVRPNRNLMRDGTTLTLPEYQQPLSKSDPQTWLTAYVNAGITAQTPIVRIYEDKPANLKAAMLAAQQLGHHPETYASVVERVNLQSL